MTQINPNAVLLVSLCAVLGALAGSVLIGLALGLGIVALAELVG